METPEDKINAYNKNTEKDPMIKAISTYEVDDVKKIVKELQGINQKLDTLNKILRRM